MMGGIMEIFARRLLGMPDTWEVFRFQTEGHGVPKDWYEFEGCIPIGKGKLKYRKGTDRAHVMFSREQIDAFIPQWEQETDKCSDCLGAGQTVAGWSRETGTRYRPCDKCRGTGRPEEK